MDGWEIAQDISPVLKGLCRKIDYDTDTHTMTSDSVSLSSFIFSSQEDRLSYLQKEPTDPRET